MITFPNCKINLGLNILCKNIDGFHDLETVFLPVNIYDILEIVKSPDDNAHLTTTGLAAGNEKNNICLKTYDLLKKDYPQITGIKVHLHKNIPVGAGLGGGSADGVFMLQLLNRNFNLDIPPEKFNEYALTMGSDCPFFLINQPCIGKGRGQLLQQVNLNLSGYKILLINPGINISTPGSFQKIVPSAPKKTPGVIVQQPPETWKDELVNDFEKPIFNQYPVLQTIKESLYRAGAIYASMTGTGSTMYGIFAKDTQISYQVAPSYFYKEIGLT